MGAARYAKLEAYVRQTATVRYIDPAHPQPNVKNILPPSQISTPTGGDPGKGASDEAAGLARAGAGVFGACELEFWEIYWSAVVFLLHGGRNLWTFPDRLRAGWGCVGRCLPIESFRGILPVLCVALDLPSRGGLVFAGFGQHLVPWAEALRRRRYRA